MAVLRRAHYELLECEELAWQGAPEVAKYLVRVRDECEQAITAIRT